jgi:hypothetical protein
MTLPTQIENEFGGRPAAPSTGLLGVDLDVVGDALVDRHRPQGGHFQCLVASGEFPRRHGLRRGSRP